MTDLRGASLDEEGVLRCFIGTTPCRGGTSMPRLKRKERKEAIEGSNAPGGVPTRHTHSGTAYTRGTYSRVQNTHKHTHAQTNAQSSPSKYVRARIYILRLYGTNPSIRPKRAARGEQRKRAQVFADKFFRDSKEKRAEGRSLWIHMWQEPILVSLWGCVTLWPWDLV